MPGNPLAEVFGFPISNTSEQAERYRRGKLCPYNNKVPSCTKDKVENPLGVCSIRDSNGIAITCPVRFREDWDIVSESAKFFFPADTTFVAVSGIKIDDKYGKSAGNIDIVLIAYDKVSEEILDFGAVEVQGVYVSGNIRNPFEAYMKNPSPDFVWNGRNYPHADYLSSSRKRLAPQLLFKRGILHSWRKKSSVVLHVTFFNTLPKLPSVPESEAEIVWLVYDLIYNEQTQRLEMKLLERVFTTFNDALNKITLSEPGDINVFLDKLKGKLVQKLTQNVTLEEILESDESIEQNEE